MLISGRVQDVTTELKLELLDPTLYELDSETELDWVDNDVKSFDPRVRLGLDKVLTDEM